MNSNWHKIIEIFTNSEGASIAFFEGGSQDLRYVIFDFEYEMKQVKPGDFLIDDDDEWSYWPSTYF